MKTTFFSILLIVAFIGCQKASNKSYLFIITDSDYSLAIAKSYKISSDSITIVLGRGLVNEKDTCVLNRELSLSERQQLSSLANRFSLDRLQEKYENDLVQDGVRLTFDLTIDGFHKNIGVSNSTEEHLKTLVEVINDLVPTKYKLPKL